MRRTGAGSLPVSYGYDSLSRMTNLVDGEGNHTSWQYDSLGRMVKKIYADGSFYQYAYSPRNWLTNRVDALGKATGYEYSNGGQLVKVDYATDADVNYQFDNLGRMTSRVDSAGTWTWTYGDQSSRILSESMSSQSHTSLVSYSYSPATYDLSSVSCGAHTTAYHWAAGRLTNVTSVSSAGSVRDFFYSYLPNSDLLSQMTSDQGLMTTRSYDLLDRLTNISFSVPSVPLVANSFSYSLDSVGRRTVRQDSDGSRTDWGYDSYDQLTSASRTNGPNGAADAAYRFGYQYDKIGNRLHEDRGTLDLDGSYNALNQLVERDWAGKLGLLGNVDGTNIAVLVQGITNAPPFYDLTNWLGGAVVHAGSNTIPIVAWLGTNATEMNRTVFMPPAKPQAFLWDRNGNLTNDGQTAYFWNDENRLIAIESLVGVKRRSEYVIDANSRRVETKYLSGWNGSAYVTTNITRFVWHGFLVLAELTGDGSPKAYNIHGLDLSQSLQGAGGIGGLLCSVRNGTNFLYTSDGNGNIVDVLTTNGAVTAHYEYSPYGKITFQSGPFANDNPWRFSSQWYERSWRHYRYVYQYDKIGNRLHEDRGTLDLDGSYNALNQLVERDWAGKLGLLGNVQGTNIVVLVHGLTNAPPFYQGHPGRSKQASNRQVVIMILTHIVGPALLHWQCRE